MKKGKFELKPCPFCGSRNIIIDSIPLRPPMIHYWAECADCNAGYRNNPRFRKEDAVKVWNDARTTAEDNGNFYYVERPAKLPDWCKVGEWVYYRGYRKIIEVKGSGLVLESAHCCNLTVYLEEIGKEVKQARLRPYNAAEMRVLIGKVLASNSRSKPFSFLVVYAEGDGSFIESYRFKYTAEELKDHFTIDGSPCGVLEHFKEGEWVK